MTDLERYEHYKKSLEGGVVPIMSFDDYILECEPTYTEDTKRLLKNHDDCYYIEGVSEYWDSWLRMVIDCFKCGMTKEEIRRALDLEHGYMYFTEFWEE